MRKIFEPHCAPPEERWATIRELRAAGIAVTATLAPLLPCDPEKADGEGAGGNGRVGGGGLRCMMRSSKTLGRDDERSGDQNL